jgi:trigger factor
VTLTITVDADAMTEKFDTALRQYQKRARIDGFRPGKVPIKFVKQRYGSTIRAQLMEETIDQTYQDALNQEQLSPVAPGNVKDISFDSDAPLVYKAVVAVAPEFELTSFDKLSVEKPVVAIRDEDIDRSLQEIREDAGVLSPNEGEAVEGNLLECDMQELDASGMPLVGKIHKDLKIEIGKNPFGEQLDQQLLGIKASEERQVVLPQADPNSKKGETQDVRYKITVKTLQNKELPELNDEFAKSIDENVASLEQLKDNIRRFWEGRMARETRERFQHQLVDSVIKAHDFNIPDAMVNDYLDRMVEHSKKSGKQDVDEDALRKNYRPTAIWNLKWRLIRQKLTEQENLAADEETLEQAIKDMVKGGADEEQVRMHYNVPDHKQQILADLTERNVLQWLEEKATVVERNIDTDEFYGRKSIVMPE